MTWRGTETMQDLGAESDSPLNDFGVRSLQRPEAARDNHHDTNANRPNARRKMRDHQQDFQGDDELPSADRHRRSEEERRLRRAGHRTARARGPEGAHGTQSG